MRNVTHNGRNNTHLRDRIILKHMRSNASYKASLLLWPGISLLGICINFLNTAPVLNTKIKQQSKALKELEFNEVRYVYRTSIPPLFYLAGKKYI